MDFVNRLGLALLIVGIGHFGSPHVYIWLPSLAFQGLGIWLFLA